MALQKSKFSIDSLFNLFSVGAGGVLYILINTIILQHYGEETLGIFNLCYAIYIVLSQVAVFGIHLSVQMYVPSFFREREKVNAVMTSALLLSLLISVIVVALSYPFTATAADFFDSKAIDAGLYYCLWGIIFFSINKVLLAYLNGVRKMKSFALFTFLRFLFMISVLCILIFFYDDPSLITLVFSLSELALFLILLVYTLRYFHIKWDGFAFQFTKNHFIFGKSAFIGNLLLDINTRVDVIMLGYLATDRDVGIYSFVLAISEGILQIPVVFRNNVNPIITKASVMKNVSTKLEKILQKNVRYFYKIIGGIALITIVLYPLGLYILGIKDYFMEYWILYAILVMGIVISAGYLPFSMLFNQMKQPKIQSLLFFVLFLTNVIGNFVFINWIGIYGAAVGTALSYIAMVFFIRTMARKYCDLRF
jgi:O-antigen/teichoic acid export membrane protein